MATELHDRLTYIYEEKNEKILPENIKKGIKIFDVEGVADVLDTSDANATASDLLQGKSAYVQGTKIEGTIPSIETLTIKPELETEQMTEYNAKIGTVTVPSLIDSAAEYSKTSRLAGSMVGGTATASQTITVNTVPGGTVLVAVMHRNAITLSTAGWTQIYHDYTVTPEGWYQFLTVYYKYAEGTSETLKVSDPASGRLAVGMWTYNQGAEPEVIWTGGNNTERISSYPVTVMTQYNDILIAHQYWSGGSGLWFSGFGNSIGTNRCSDGRLMMVGITNSTDQGRITHDTTSQGTGCLVRLKSVFTSDSIRKGRTILGITGTYTEDADATAGDIMTGKTAYVNGVKLTGNIATLGEEVQVTATNAEINDENTKFIISSQTPSSGILSQGATYQITADGDQVMDALGLAPDMLRAGVNVLGVEGTYGADASEFNAKYETDGLTTGLYPSLMITSIQGINLDTVTNADRVFDSLPRLKSLPDINLPVATSMRNFCNQDQQLVFVPNMDIPAMQTMSYAFYNCRNLPTVNFTNANKLEAIDGAFMNCKSIIKLPSMNYNYIHNTKSAFESSGITGEVNLIGLTRSGVNITMNSMFKDCHNLTGMTTYNKQGTSTLNTQYMFYNCSNLQTINNCNFFNLNYTLCMFQNCYNLRSIANTGFSWTTPASNYGYGDKTSMFANCSNLVTLDNNFWLDVKAAGFNYVFDNCYNLIFPEEGVKVQIYGYNFYYGGFQYTFRNCYKLKTADLHFMTYMSASRYNYATSLYGTFHNCNNLHTVNIYNMQINNVGTLFQYQPFNGCTNLTKINIINFRHLNTSYNVRSYTGLAYGSGILGINNIEGINLYDSSSAVSMFTNCHRLYDLGTEPVNFVKTNNLYGCFANCYNLVNVNANSINLLNKIHVAFMFQGCNSIPEFQDYNFVNAVNVRFLFANTNPSIINNINFPVAADATNFVHGSVANVVSNINMPAATFSHTFAGLKANVLQDINLPKMSNLAYMFDNSEINIINNMHTNTIIDGVYAFANSHVNKIEGMSIPTVNNAYGMFTGASSIQPFYDLGIKSVNWANYMFSNLQMNTISNLNLIINNSSWYLFAHSPNLIEVRDVNLLLQNGQGYDANLFMNCQNLTNVINLSLPNKANGYYMFTNCFNLTSVDGLSMPLACYYVYTFANCYNLRTVTNLNLSPTGLVDYMFLNCRNLTVAPNLDTAQRDRLTYLYQGCSNLTDIPAIECDNITYANTLFGALPNLVNFGGWINLGNAFKNYSHRNAYATLYLNWFPNLSQESMFNIVNNLATTSNYQRCYVTNHQYYNVLDQEHRNILYSTKHRYTNIVSG